MPKLTVLGGSSIAVPELIAAIQAQMTADRTFHVTLHGRTAAKLERVGVVSQRMAESTPGLTVDFTTDLESALTGADFVLNQVRVGGLDARAYDETFPHRWGIPGEETVGPGGAANAWRTLPAVLEICRVIEKVAPTTTLLSFTNPASVVQRMVNQHTGLQVIGLCDGPWSMHNIVAKTLGVDRDSVRTQYMGMHHFGWITSATIDGQERIHDVLAADSACSALSVDPAVGRALGVLPHTYFKYFFHPDRMLAKQQKADQPRARQLQQLEGDLLAAYEQHAGAGKPDAVNKRSAIWYEVVVVPVLFGLAYQQPARLAINITNNGLIDALPDDTIVELTSEIVDGEIITHKPTQLPPHAMMGMLQLNAAYERTLVDAIINDDADLMLQAFLMNPLIPSYTAASEILGELWERRALPPETEVQI